LVLSAPVPIASHGIKGSVPTVNRGATTSERGGAGRRRGALTSGPPTSGTVHFESTEHFVRYQVAGSPLLASVGDASAAVRDRVVRDVRTALAPYETAEGLGFPIAAYLATASA
jgi:hypothetical protein